MAQVHNPSLEHLDYHRFPVLHLFSHYRTLGGVESVLRLHWEFDAKIGVQSELIIYSEDPSHSSERVHCLGIHSDDSVSAVGGKLRAVTEMFETARAGAATSPEWGAAEAYAFLGRALYAQSDVVGAREALERALLIAPDFGFARRLMAQITR